VGILCHRAHGRRHTGSELYVDERSVTIEIRGRLTKALRLADFEAEGLSAVLV
jgi:hypothetical protein